MIFVVHLKLAIAILFSNFTDARRSDKSNFRSKMDRIAIKDLDQKRLLSY
jgi:hypothetical protein